MENASRVEATIGQLRDEVMEELRHEDVSIQIRVAFAVLVAVIFDGSQREPEEVRSTLLDLQDIIKVVS
jgi:hypothetical protein